MESNTSERDDTIRDLERRWNYNDKQMESIQAEITQVEGLIAECDRDDRLAYLHHYRERLLQTWHNIRRYQENIEDDLIDLNAPGWGA